MVKRLEVELNPLGKFLEEHEFLMKTDLSLMTGSFDFRTIDYDCDDGCDGCDDVCNESNPLDVYGLGGARYNK